MKMIRDLIENTNCEVFDFKWGGEDGYKSRFATDGIACAAMQVATVYRPYSLLIVLLDKALNSFKKLTAVIIESRPFKRRLRSVLRKFGKGTF